MLKSFKTNNVIVRKFELEDAEQTYLNFAGNSNYSNMCNTIGNEMIECESIEQTKLIIKSAINEYYTDEPIWAVEDKRKKILVGFIRVSNYSEKNKICNITWAMSCEYLKNFFMKEALIKICNFLFSKKNVELIECSYYEQNKATSIVLEEIGMTREAILRDRRINVHTNKKEDFIIYSINKQEFFEYLNSEMLHDKISNQSKIHKELKRKI